MVRFVRKGHGKATLTSTAGFSYTATAVLGAPLAAPSCKSIRYIHHFLRLSSMTTTSPTHGNNSSIPVMAVLPAVSLDLNATLGATFLGFAFTCMYVPHYQSLDSAVTILPLTCHAGSTASLRFKHGCTSLTISRTRRYCAALYLSYGNPLDSPQM